MLHAPRSGRFCPPSSTGKLSRPPSTGSTSVQLLKNRRSFREAQFDPVEDRAITFVMPHFGGGSVHDALLEDYRFSLTESIQIAIDSLDALAYLHREHYAIHRDTKPGNVLLDGDRKRGYLSDFGSAALIDSAGEASAVLGTNVYRPPEARPSGRVGVSADLYGIAMTLWEMVNGRLPWDRLELEAVERRLQRGLRAVTDAQLSFAPHVPDRLRRVIRKGLQRNPAARFKRAEEFIRALRRVTSIDWRHQEGTGLEGEWIGTWPPRRRQDQRTLPGDGARPSPRPSRWKVAVRSRLSATRGSVASDGGRRAYRPDRRRLGFPVLCCC